jgi:uncharacterized membrane protein (UPF0182 family)
LTTYNELQIFRTYYHFTVVDIDRYEVDGRETQVTVSAREIEFDALPAESRTWVNRHLVYTHCFGVAMSPVSEVTADGLPEFYFKDIPPNASVGIEVTQPRIYYGEATTDFVIVNSGTRELDYPQGGQNVYTSYNGGVVLDSALRKLVYTVKFGDPRIILPDSVTTSRPGTRRGGNIPRLPIASIGHLFDNLTGRTSLLGFGHILLLGKNSKHRHFLIS